MYLKTRILYFLFLLLISFKLSAQKIDVEKEKKKIDDLEEINLGEAIKYTDSILKFDFPEKTQIKLKNGFLNIRASNYEKSVKLFKEVINTSKDKRVLAEAYLGIGQSKGLSNNKHDAINYTLKALEIAKKINDQELKAQSFSLLAYIYYSSSDYPNAIKYTKDAVEIQKIRSDNYSLASLYNNIAVYFEKNNQLDSAQVYSYKSLELNKLLGKKYLTATLYNNIAKLLEKKQNFNKAIAHYKKSIQIHTSISSNQINALANIAALYDKIGELKKAKKYYIKAVEIAIKNKNNKNLEKQYSALLNLSIKERDFDNSIFFQKKRDSLANLLLVKENEEKIKSIENQYQLLVKENELNQELELNKKNKLLFIIVTVLLLFLGLFLFQHNRNKRLTLKQDKLVLEHKVLRTQMNPHFIFNALTSIQKTIFDGDPLKSATYLSKFAKLIRQNFEFVSKTEILLFDDIDALKNYIDTQQLRFDNKFEYKIKIDEEINTLQVNIPPMLLQPFVENAIEHGLKPKTSKGLLEIEIFKQKSLYHFKIIDNGIGINNGKEKEKREHSLDVFLKRLKLRYLGEEKLFSIKPLTDNKGTVVSFSLKLNEW